MKLNPVDSTPRSFCRLTLTLPDAVPGAIVARPGEPNSIIRVVAFSNGDCVDELTNTRSETQTQRELI